MNFVSMLMGASEASSSQKRRRKQPKTTEQVIKHRASMRAKRNKRWAEAFEKLDNRATSRQLAATLGYSVVGVNSQLLEMRKEDPPVVEKIDEVDRDSPGIREYVYRWIGE